MSRRSAAILLDGARRHMLVGDGAMGTQMQLAGMEPGSAGELWNVARPEAVERIHRAYVNAGAHIILSNTFGGSRLALARHGLEDRAAELNRAGAALARRAAAGRAWVLGDVGPFGGFLAPLGEHEPLEVYAAFLEQARALLEGGADGILVETMTSPDEMALAVRAARDAGAGVVGASMSFDPTPFGPRTMMGTSPEDAARAMAAAGAAIVGTNCGTLDAAGYVEVVRAFRQAAPAAALMVQPNAGRPSLDEDGNAVYGMTAAEFAGALPELVAAGANIVGGCCGTTPTHIAALAARAIPA